jgi:hypothetical protein
MGTKMRRGLVGATGLAAIACAACCAPLVAPFVIPPLAALFAGGGAALAIGGQLWIGGAAVAGAAAFAGLRWWQARQRAAAAAKAAACDCPPENGCTADACALPASPAGGRSS